MSPELSATESSFELEKPLRPHQEDMLRAIQSARHAGVPATYIEAATGCGKDFTIARDIRDFLEENPDSRVLYLCHNGAILDQASQEIAAVTGSASHGRMFGGEYQDQEQIVFATFQTMSRPLGGGSVYEAFDPKEFGYIVVNESHHAPAPTYQPVIEYFQPEFLLGATATPDRRDEQDIKETFGEPIYRLPLEEAIAKGYLARPNYHVLTDQIHQLDQSDPDQKDIEQINGIVFVPKRDEEIIGIITDHLEKIDDPRTLVFCPSIDHAEYFSDLFPGKSAALHSGIDSDEQDRVLEAFRNGDIDTLMVVDMLNEGIHVPQVNAIVFLRSTESKTVFFQQLGRGLGLTDGKDEVLVLDFVASWNRLSTLGELQTGIREHRDHTPAGSRQNWEIDTNISFNFSPEALEAVKVIQDARTQEQRRRRRNIGEPRLSKAEREELELKEMLGVEQLPQQRIRSNEWQRYGAAIMAGDKTAKAELVSRRLLRAYASAKSYIEKEGSAELTVEDYFQYAIEGLYMGIDRYSNGGGQARGRILANDISGAMANQLSRRSKERGLVRMPSHIADALTALERKKQKIASQIDSSDPEARRLLTDEWEMANRIGTDPDEIREFDFIKRVLLYENHAPVEAANDRAIEEGDNPAESSVFRATEEKLRREALEEALSGLSYRERRVLVLRYGLGDGKPQTIDEVARKFNVSRERIRQVENQSIKKAQQQPEATGYNQFRVGRLRSKPLRELLDASSRHRAKHIVATSTSTQNLGERWAAPARAKYLASVAILALNALEHETSRRGGSIRTTRFMGGIAGYVSNITGQKVTSDDAEKAVTLLNKAGLLHHTWYKSPYQESLPVDYVKVNDPGLRRAP